jgi:hypothetical protein
VSSARVADRAEVAHVEARAAHGGIAMSGAGETGGRRETAAEQRRGAHETAPRHGAAFVALEPLRRHSLQPTTADL